MMKRERSLAFSASIPFLPSTSATRVVSTCIPCSPLPPVLPSRRALLQCSAGSVGKGFGAQKPDVEGVKKPLSNWATQYKAYVNRNGEMLCGMAWEGYSRLGRGAVFANESVSTSNIGVAQPGKTGKIGTAMPSFYVSKDQLIERNEKNTIPQMAPILRRIGLYDPESQFVVVFETDGMQGADIVTPNQKPAEVWKRTKSEAQAGSPEKQ